MCRTGRLHALGWIGKLLAAFVVFACLAGAMMLTQAYAAGTNQVTLPINQVFNSDGASTPPSETFTYLLMPKHAGNPMPDGAASDSYTFTVTGSENMQIGPISFDNVGTYYYELKCVTTAETGYTVDSQQYTITVFVTNDSSPKLIVYLSDGNKASAIAFQHTYKSPPAPPKTPIPVKPANPSGPKTGDDSNPVLWGSLMAGGIVLLVLIIWIESRSSRKNKRTGKRQV